LEEVLSSVHPGTLELAKYPFLQEAGTLMRDLGISLDDLGTKENWPIVQRAKQRVIQAIGKARVSSDLGDLDVEILSFPLAMVLVKSTNNEYLIQRYALSEAVRVEELLEGEKTHFITFIFKKVLNIDLFPISEKIGGREYQFKIRIQDYLQRASQFHKPEWKLVNRILANGYVLLRTPDLIRLIREEIRSIIFKRTASLQVPTLPSSLQQIVGELKLATPKPKASMIDFQITPESFPPCVRMAISMLERGQSLPHYGNFLLATYMLKTGKPIEEVTRLFTKSPDYKESIAKYQVEHIAGLKGGRTKYSVPSCRTLQAHNFCWKDPVGCANIVNPTQYGRGQKKIQKGKKEGIGGSSPSLSKETRIGVKRKSFQTKTAVNKGLEAERQKAKTN
jgi:DNA primase large subunit